MENSYPQDFAFKLAKFQNFTKNTIEIEPDGNRGTYQAGSRTRFTLPHSSTIDFSDICLHFNGKTTYATITDDHGTPKVGVGEVLFPRNIAQLIQTLTIYANGKILQQITNYDEIFSIVQDWVEESEQSKILSNSQPAPQVAAFAQFVPSNSESDYVIKDWLGIMSKGSSSHILDTNILGTVIIEILWNDANCLMVNTCSDATFTAGSTVVNKITTADFELTNMKLSMNRLSMPEQYYEMIQRVLSSGKRRIMFPHYEMVEGSPANGGFNSVRFNMNSSSINWMIGYYAQTNRKATGKPKLYNATTKTSDYYKRDGNKHQSSSFQIGSTKVPVNPQKTTDCYVNTLRLWGCKADEKYHHYGGITSLTNFKNQFFVSPLSLEYSENQYDRDVLLQSGLDTNTLPIAMSFESTLDTAPVNITPVVLVNTYRIMEFSDNQVVDVVI